jgi:cytoskeletal protein CcmA (bactofilin family)
MFHKAPRSNETPANKADASQAPKFAVRNEQTIENEPAAEKAQYEATTEAVQKDTVEQSQPQEMEKEVTMTNETNETQQQQRPVDIPGNNPYQRSMNNPAQYGYAGMQSGSNTQSQSSGRRLMIGEGITLSGEIESCDHLVVEGTVEAALKGAKVLDIAQNGTYYGTVEIENATIAGRFEGDIRVDGRLTVKAGGVIMGTISYRELAVEAGAVIDGKIAPLTGEATTKTQKTATAGAADFTKSRAATKQSDNKTDEQLPFAEKATA